MRLIFALWRLCLVPEVDFAPSVAAGAPGHCGACMGYATEIWQTPSAKFGTAGRRQRRRGTGLGNGPAGLARGI